MQGFPSDLATSLIACLCISFFSSLVPLLAWLLELVKEGFSRCYFDHQIKFFMELLLGENACCDHLFKKNTSALMLIQKKCQCAYIAISEQYNTDKTMIVPEAHLNYIPLFLLAQVTI